MNDHDLDQLLKTADLPEVPPVGFQRDVWFRIESNENASWKVRANRFLEHLMGYITLPPVAIATCAAMVLAGVWFGSESGKPNPVSEIGYVQSISPFAHSQSR